MKNDLFEPKKDVSGKINVRVHTKIEHIFNKIYSECYSCKGKKYTKGQLVGLAIASLNKSMKDKNVKRGDDIAKKLKLQITE